MAAKNLLSKNHHFAVSNVSIAFIFRSCVTDDIQLNNIKTQICQLPVQQFEGIKSPRREDGCVPAKKFHYDKATDSCVPVEFSGCFGTDNLFDEEIQCMNFCHVVMLNRTTESTEKRELQ